MNKSQNKKIRRLEFAENALAGEVDKKEALVAKVHTTKITDVCMIDDKAKREAALIAWKVIEDHNVKVEEDKRTK